MREETALEVFTLTSKKEFANPDDYEIGDEVLKEYDSEKDKDILEINYDERFPMPKKVQDFFESNFGDYKLIILESDFDDNYKVKIKIGIFED